jgi:hypothetical protein
MQAAMLLVCGLVVHSGDAQAIVLNIIKVCGYTTNLVASM